MKRRIENNFNCFDFTTFQRKLYIYPTIFKENVIEEYLSLKNDLDLFNSLNEQNKIVTKAAMSVRNEIRNMSDTMPWPPNVSDLSVSKVNIGNYLETFMNIVLTGSSNVEISSRANRLKLSIGQDIVYAVTNGKIKTPKSILYPSVIKSLTNFTELITLNKLGHGVSDSILEELFTENAFRLIDISGNETFIPTSIEEGHFTIAVYDNIDRMEETLSGKFRPLVATKDVSKHLQFSLDMIR